MRLPLCNTASEFWAALGTCTNAVRGAVRPAVRGAVLMAAGGAESKLLHAAKFGGNRVRSSIVAAQGALFVRTDDRLFCFRK